MEAVGARVGAARAGVTIIAGVLTMMMTSPVTDEVNSLTNKVLFWAVTGKKRRGFCCALLASACFPK